MEKPLDDFYKDKSKKDGCVGLCKACYKIVDRAKLVAKRPEAKTRNKGVKNDMVPSARSRSTTYIKSIDIDEETRAKRRASCRAYHLAHLEKERARRRAYYATNREKILQEQQEKQIIRSSKKKAMIPVVSIQSGYNICATCRKEKPFEEFYKDKNVKSGYRYSCKECCDKVGKNRQVGKLRNRRNQHVTKDHKWCYGCKQERPIDKFHPDKTKRDGLHTRCNDCHAISRQDYWENNKEHLTQQRKEWYSKPENRLKVLEYNRKRLGHIFTGDIVNYERILESNEGWCYICEQPILPDQATEFDHVIPLQPPKGMGRKPGPHTEDNIRVTHKVCNRRKHNKLLEEMTPFQRRGIV